MTDHHQFARDAATLRHQLLRYLEHGMGRQNWAYQLSTESRFLTPPAWRSLSPVQLASKLADAETARIRGGLAWAFTAAATDAVEAAAREPWNAPITHERLPNDSGMLLFARPIAVYDQGTSPITAATWGPVHGQADRVQISWWSDTAAVAALHGRPLTKEIREATGPLILHNESYLTIAPGLNDPLTDDADVTDTDTLVRRIIVAAWFALVGSAVDPEPVPVKKGMPPMLVHTTDPAATQRLTVEAIERDFAAASAIYGKIIPRSATQEPDVKS
jgi:hypothetical protein